MDEPEEGHTDENFPHGTGADDKPSHYLVRSDYPIQADTPSPQVVCHNPAMFCALIGNTGFFSSPAERNPTKKRGGYCQSNVCFLPKPDSMRLGSGENIQKLTLSYEDVEYGLRARKAGFRLRADYL
ncbi:hypothetical protein [Desulfovibrio sp. ZJ200]|uniref:hypothetical protein n=1 Tax=Desulfovibrio sp. ZJ200 TaxID=2709792 RepID=UPI0013EC658C|nr:hypothetical protein [Desulfovibrio sp. ZJ200]